MADQESGLTIRGHATRSRSSARMVLPKKIFGISVNRDVWPLKRTVEIWGPDIESFGSDHRELGLRAKVDCDRSFSERARIDRARCGPKKVVRNRRL